MLSAERYHGRVLKHARVVRNVLAYVLNNARRHAAQRGVTKPRGWVDPCSSGSEFGGWNSPLRNWTRMDKEDPLPPARSWLLRVGWRRGGLLRIDHVPGAVT